jgi:acyl-CoA dehydrogenase
MTYQAPVADIQFTLTHVIGANALADTDRFSEATDDMSSAILTEAAKLAESVLTPLQRPGDLYPARLENGIVRCSPGYAGGYQAIAEGGWVGINADPEFGGMGLPMTLTTAVGEMMNSACLSLALNLLMTQGQIEALEAHASDEIKALYLPKLITGAWTGTMNLTEPQAGSDVGALTTKAVPNSDGTYAISGQKIYISWGDHDLAENICHLVLARLPGAPMGTKGISLFLVPKYLPDSEGKPGVANRLNAVSLEHKMGLGGSPTAVMAFNNATGWMIGAENTGMAAMFTMMNNARLGVGTQGVGVAEAAYQHALAYAVDRKQGRSPIKGGTGTILDHADVRRMLMTMKALTRSARAICYDCAYSLDMAKATGDATWAARAAFLTPIAKSFGTDVGSEVSDLGIQVHGGMGFIEETGAAQFARDVRVTRIYEGTNGIQAMDMVGRKLSDGGSAAEALLDEIEATAVAARDAHPLLADALQDAGECLAETTRWMLDQELNDRFAGAAHYLRAFAMTLGGHYLMKAALAAPEDKARLALAQFHLRQLVPQVTALALSAQEGAAPLYALSAQDFAR